MAGNPRVSHQRRRIPRSSVDVWFVDENQVLIHSLRINGSLEDEQVLGSDEAMLHARLEMELAAPLKQFGRKHSLVRPSPQNKSSAFLHLKPLILLLVHLERKISAFANHEKLLHARMFVQRHDHATPVRFDDAFTAALDSL